MERELKFRAKDSNGKWLYGFVMTDKKNSMIIPVNTDGTLTHELYSCDTETIGQYTGLHDLNGKEIYEGDIVTMKRNPEGRKISVMSRHLVKCDNVADWCFSSLAFEVCASYSMCGFDEKYSIFNHRVEVIGNIHDNPELAQPYSLNLPAPRQRKKRDKGFQVEFVVSDNPKPEPYAVGNKIVYEVTQEEMHDAILKQMKEAGNEES